MSLTAIILAKNEEKNIKRCIDSLAWADEILVIDDNSTDKTREIAKNLHAQILSHSLSNDFAAQRNFALTKAKGEWVLFLDADEVVSSDLASEIQKATLSVKNGFFLKREDMLWGKKLRYGETGNIWLLRLARKDKGRWKGKVHEIWDISGEVDRLSHPLIHYAHENVAGFLKKINFYSTLRAEELYDKGIKANWLSIIAYTKAKFLLNFFIKQGFRDGIPGLIHALLMSFYSFLARGKLWQLWQNE